MVDTPVPVVDERFDAPPSVGRLILVQHWTKDYNEFVMTQEKTPQGIRDY
jgi:hypothetical protein